MSLSNRVLFLGFLVVPLLTSSSPLFAAGDCNHNGIPDQDELVGNDCNNDNVPDECGVPITCNSFETTRHADWIYPRLGEHVVLKDDVAAVGTTWARGTCAKVLVYRTVGMDFVFEQSLDSVHDCSGYELRFDLDGDVIAIVGHDGSSPFVDVHRFDGLTWQLEQTLTPSGETAGFGDAVAVSGDTVVVGARFDSSAAHAAGAAFVFQYDGTSWVEAQKLVASDADYDRPPGRQFGASAAIQGDLLLIGAGDYDRYYGPHEVYAFWHNGTNWSEVQKVTGIRNFGMSLSISGQSTLIGGQKGNCAVDGLDYYCYSVRPNQSPCGCQPVRSFELNGQSLVEKEDVVAWDVTSVSYFGDALSHDGNVLAVGSSNELVQGCDCPTTYVYRFDGTSWTRSHNLLPSILGDGREFGRSVSVSGNRVLIGSPSEGCGGGTTCGAIYLYDLSGSDDNCNGVADACECTPVPTPLPAAVSTKNRYLSFSGGESGRDLGVRVRFDNLPGVHGFFNGATMWVGPPTALSENSGSVHPRPDAENVLVATLQCEPYMTDWSAFSLPIHVYDPNLVPGATYTIDFHDPTCGSFYGRPSFSQPLTITLSDWGDVTGPFDDEAGRWPAPDGQIDVPFDVVSILDKFENRPGAPSKVVVDLEPGIVDGIVSISDVVAALESFRGAIYPFDLGLPRCPEAPLRPEL